MTSKHGWRVGDRVSVDPTNHGDRITGTVIEVDPPGIRPGVRVRLDGKVRGVDECFATHDELTLVERGQDDH